MADNRAKVPSKSALRARALSPEIRSAIFLSREEYAGILGVSVPTIARAMQAGTLEVFRVGKSVRIRNPLLAERIGA